MPDEALDRRKPTEPLSVIAPVSANRRVRRGPDPILAGAFLVGTLLFVIRGWARITAPGLWAEDGTRFFPESQTLGVSSIFVQFAGYIHVLPRVIALALSPLPLRWIPSAYTLAAVGATLAIFALVLSSRLQWLIPSRIARGIAFILLCVLPGFTEPYGNLANLIFVGAIATLFLGLSQDPASRHGRVLELVAVAVLVLSGPLSMFTFPVYGYRLLRCRSRHSLMVSAVFVAAAVAQLAIYSSSARNTPGGATFELFQVVTTIRLPGTLLAGAVNWIPAWQQGNLGTEGPLFLAAAVLTSVVCLGGSAVVMFLVSGLALAAAVHAYGPYLLGGGLIDRHFLLPQVVIVTLLIAVVAQGAKASQPAIRNRLRKPRPRRAARVLCSFVAAGLLLAGYQGIYRDFHLTGFRTRPDMSQLEPCLATLSPRCRTQEAPAGWYVRLSRG